MIPVVGSAAGGWVMFVPPTSPGQKRPGPAGSPRTVGGLNGGMNAFVAFARLRASALISGVQSFRCSSLRPTNSYGAGLIGNGCVGASFSVGTFDIGTVRSSNPQIGSPVSRLKEYRIACFVAWNTPGTRRPPTLTSMTIGAVDVS